MGFFFLNTGSCLSPFCKAFPVFCLPCSEQHSSTKCRAKQPWTEPSEFKCQSKSFPLYIIIISLLLLFSTTTTISTTLFITGVLFNDTNIMYTKEK